MAGLAQLKFAAEAHSADAIQRAAYKFSDRFAIELFRDGAAFVCELHPTNKVELDGETLNAFRVEVLDEVLRARIREETAGVRNVILALAFSNVDFGERANAPDSESEGRTH